MALWRIERICRVAVKAFARHQSGQLNDASGGYRRLVEAGKNPAFLHFVQRRLSPHPSTCCLLYLCDDLAGHIANLLVRQGRLDRLEGDLEGDGFLRLFQTPT